MPTFNIETKFGEDLAKHIRYLIRDNLNEMFNDSFFPWYRGMQERLDKIEERLKLLEDKGKI